MNQSTSGGVFEFNQLVPGTYVLFCTLPQHAALGMKTTIVVK